MDSLPITTQVYSTYNDYISCMKDQILSPAPRKLRKLDNERFCEAMNISKNFGIQTKSVNNFHNPKNSAFRKTLYHIEDTSSDRSFKESQSSKDNYSIYTNPSCTEDNILPEEEKLERSNSNDEEENLNKGIIIKQNCEIIVDNSNNNTIKSANHHDDNGKHINNIGHTSNHSDHADDEVEDHVDHSDHGNHDDHIGYTGHNNQKEINIYSNTKGLSSLNDALNYHDMNHYRNHHPNQKLNGSKAHKSHIEHHQHSLYNIHNRKNSLDNNDQIFRPIQLIRTNSKEVYASHSHEMFMNSLLSLSYLDKTENLKKSSESTPKSSVTKGDKESALSDGSTTRKSKKCNCKQSKCLKLYCECLAFGEYCDDTCGCVGCHNTQRDSSLRDYALSLIAERKMSNEQQGIKRGNNKIIRGKGCTCKKSACLKKYCECYNSETGCGPDCRCENCKNIYNNPDNIQETLSNNDSYNGELSIENKIIIKSEPELLKRQSSTSENDISKIEALMKIITLQTEKNPSIQSTANSNRGFVPFCANNNSSISSDRSSLSSLSIIDKIIPRTKGSIHSMGQINNDMSQNNAFKSINNPRISNVLEEKILNISEENKENDYNMINEPYYVQQHQQRICNGNNNNNSNQLDLLTQITHDKVNFKEKPILDLNKFVISRNDFLNNRHDYNNKENYKCIHNNATTQH